MGDDLGSALGSGEGGGGGYEPQWVTFAPNTSISTQNLTAPAAPTKFSACFNFNFTSDGNHNLFAVDPINSLSILVYASITGGEYTTFVIAVEDETASNYFQVTANVDLPSIAEDINLIVSVDTDFEAGLKHGKILINGVDKTASTNDNASAFNMVASGLQANIGFDISESLDGDVADFFIAVGQSWMDGSGEIPSETIELFYDDGAPVDPTIAVAELGSPTILLSGNAASFATNQGTGGTLLLAKTYYAQEAGGNGAGSRTLTGAVAGQTVALVQHRSTGNDISSDFEAVISVNGQLQQLSSDHDGANLLVTLTPASLTDA
jgi:hypothetical protein